MPARSQYSAGEPTTLLPFFPAGLPGELLVSRVGIYHILRGHATTRATYQELFYTIPFSLTHWAPLHLERLAARISGDPASVLKAVYQDSTILPLFAMFLGDRLPEGLGVGMTGALASLPRRIVGESGTTHLCLRCLAQDTDEYGIPYIHREHQIPAVTTCWKHGIRLIDRCPHCRCPFERPKDLVLAPWRGCHACERSLLETPDLSCLIASDVEIALARFGKELLDSTQTRLDSNQLVELYRKRAIELGFQRGKNVDRVGLLAALEEHIGKDLLANVDRAYGNGKTSGWFHVLAGSLTAEAPLTRHLILAQFLFRESGAFIVQLKAASAKPAAQTRRNQRSKQAQPPVSGFCDGARGETLDQAVRRLVLIARQSQLSVDDLWKAEYAAMKKLVKSKSEAVRIIEEQLALPSDGSAAPRGRNSECAIDTKIDSDWADAIKAAATTLYDKGGKPERISINSLLRNAKPRRGGWPTAKSFPLAHAMCDEMKESSWHFYARRILWAMTRCGEHAIRTRVITESTLEYHKASDIYLYFSDRGYHPTMEPFARQLASLGIPRNWLGPNPDRKYRPVGRRYVAKAHREPVEGPTTTLAEAA